jgi:CO dehydrogenase nickel-insertion accessory protein CooC1
MSLENILTHSIDGGVIIIADMVAGVDAFANTLHMQFDMVIILVEPTSNSVTVYNQFQELFKGADCPSVIWILANKIHEPDDVAYMHSTIDKKRIIGHIGNSSYIKGRDRLDVPVSIHSAEAYIKKAFEKIWKSLNSTNRGFEKRYPHLLKLHRKYSAKFFPDKLNLLLAQIDDGFDPRSVYEQSN